MNYLQMVQRLKRESGRSGSSITTLTGLTGDDQLLADWVADAHLEIERRPHGWSFMRKSLNGTMVIGQRGYEADELNVSASDFGRWVPPATEDYVVTAGLTSSTQAPLDFVDWELFRREFELKASASGPTRYWSIAPDSKMYFGPTPDKAYLMRADYYRKPVPLTLNTDTPDYDAEYHMLIVWRALMECASFDAAPEVYQRATSNFDAIDSDMRLRYGPRVGIARRKL